MKTTAINATRVYNILNAANLSKMGDDVKFATVRLLTTLRPFANSYQEALDIASNKLKPEGIEAIISKIQSAQPLTSEEGEKWHKFNSDMDRCMNEEAQKEVEFDFAPFDEAQMKSFFSGLNCSGTEALLIYDLISKE